MVVLLHHSGTVVHFPGYPCFVIHNSLFICSLQFYISMYCNTLVGTPFDLFFQKSYLLQRIHPSVVMKEMLSKKMLTKDDCKNFKNVPVNYHMRNHMILNYIYSKGMLCLFMFLETLQQIDSQIYAALLKGILISSYTYIYEHTIVLQLYPNKAYYI